MACPDISDIPLAHTQLTFKWPLAPLLILALLCLLTYSIFMALWGDGEAKAKIEPAKGGSKKTR